MKRWLPVLCLVLIPTTLICASAWEGSAMMSAYGEFPDSGNYGACNSFPRNTAVEVVNLENGKTVTVIITKGSDNPGIFLLLSPEAARSLSMEPGMVSRVRVSAPRNMTESVGSSAPTADPDFNPSLLAARSVESAGQTVPEPSGQVEEAAPEDPLAEAGTETDVPEEQEKAAFVAEAEETTPPEEEPPEPLPAPDSVETTEAAAEKAPEIKEEPLASPEAIVRSDVTPREERPIAAYLEIPESRTPEDAAGEEATVYGLERPGTVELPVEAELADANLKPDELPEAALLRQAWPEDPAPTAELADCEIRMDESGKPEALALEEVPAEPEKSPQAVLEEPSPVRVAEEDLAEETAEEKEPEAEIVISLEPAESRPPETATLASDADREKDRELPLERDTRPAKAALTEVEPGKYYIQIGAFKSSSALDSAIKKLNGAFPVTVETMERGVSTLYRLFIGPLGRDETGVVLVQMKSLGFRDAFLKN